MTENERHKVAIVARRLGEALESGLITKAEFCDDMRRLAEIAMLLTVIHREEEPLHEAEILPFPAPQGNA